MDNSRICIRFNFDLFRSKGNTSKLQWHIIFNIPSNFFFLLRFTQYLMGKMTINHKPQSGNAS